MSRRRAIPGDPDRRLQNLARLLELKGDMQTELASKAGLAPAYVNQLLTGRRKSPSLDVLDRLASALGVSSAVLIDRRLTDAELRTELSQGALRAALAAGISHPKFSRFRGTGEAPTTVEGWEWLARVLEIADGPAPTPSAGRTTPRKGSKRR